MAEYIGLNPKILKEFVPSLNKTIKRVCQIFVERYLNKESRQGLLEYIYDMTFVNSLTVEHLRPRFHG